jgi:hypothetical protein
MQKRIAVQLSALMRSPMAYVAASIPLLIPCFWQSRIQAGDLSSHVYNAWLAQLIEKGQAPGLTLVHLNTNVLFDWMLSAMLNVAGVHTAERIVVSIAVLIFAWGAFAFVSVVSGKISWSMLPVIGMLAYGWVFHMGFFNFYMSLGLSFGAMALCWNWRPVRCAGAIPLFAIAWLAHALPVVFAVGLLPYLWLARRLGSRGSAYLLAGSMVGIVAARAVVKARFLTQWFPTQFLSATGLDQVLVFDGKYTLIIFGLLLVWAFAFIGVLRQRKFAGLVSSVPFHFCLLTAFGLLVLPTEVLIPSYKHSLAFIADRMSLALSICICALLAEGRNRTAQNYLTAIVVLIFAVYLFRDERSFNALEDRMEQVVAALPPGQRVVAAIETPTLRVNPLTHMIDRVCVGRCYSYANYEPSTAQFRIRVMEPNGIVASTYQESWALQGGRYIVRGRDLPIYDIRLDSHGDITPMMPTAGSQVGMSFWEP